MSYFIGKKLYVEAVVKEDRPEDYLCHTRAKGIPTKAIKYRVTYNTGQFKYAEEDNICQESFYGNELESNEKLFLGETIEFDLLQAGKVNLNNGKAYAIRTLHEFLRKIKKNDSKAMEAILVDNEMVLLNQF